MTHVLILIGGSEAGALHASLVQRAASAAGANAAPQWLASREACEIAVTIAGSDASVQALTEKVRDAIGRAPVDVNVLPAASRRKRLLVADMDSTVIGQECIDELADFAGLKAEVAAITERAMRGEIEFAAALEARVALLADLDESVLQRVFDERVRLTPGATTLTATMRAGGAEYLLVSGGFTFFTGRVAALAGFDRTQANRLEIDAGRLTGRVAKPILGRDAKLAALVARRTELGLARADTLAMGDGANDLDMIREAGLGVAFRAKPIVAAQAHARIEQGDLTALLYLQGYAREEFAA
jgi:phosphoserine phosphatase